MCENYYKCKKFWRAQELAQQQSPSLCSLNHRSENPEELLFCSGIKTHHIEGTRETGFLRRFHCAVVILKYIPKCSFRKHVNFFSTLMKGKLCWSWGLILLNIFINNLSHGLCCALLALAGDTKLVRIRGCHCCWPWLPLGRPWKAAGTRWNSGKANVEFSPWLLPSAAYKGLWEEGEAELFTEVKRRRTRVSSDRLQQGKFHLRIRETHSQWGWSPAAGAAGAEFMSLEIS